MIQVKKFITKTRSLRICFDAQGSVAQLVERATENRKVTGSTPVGATIRPPGFYSGGGFFFKRALPSPYVFYVLCIIFCAPASFFAEKSLDFKKEYFSPLS